MTEADMRERLQLLRRSLKESQAYMDQFKAHEGQLKAAAPDDWEEIRERLARAYSAIEHEIKDLERKLKEES